VTFLADEMMMLSAVIREGGAENLRSLARANFGAASDAKAAAEIGTRALSVDRVPRRAGF